jgi:hypothetical protein
MTRRTGNRRRGGAGSARPKPESPPRETPSTPLEIRAAVLISVFAVSLPFLFAPIPPSTDLAQHVAQVRLVHDALSGHHPELAISWLAPNNLVYALLGALSVVLPPLWVARVGLWLLAMAWALATVVLAVKRNRSPASALLASVLAFQAGLYWGLLNFLLGWPIFVAWLHLTSQPAESSRHWRRGTALSGLALGLYGAHVLWFAFGGFWLLAVGLLRRYGPREQLLRLATLIPGVLLAVIWYPQLAASRALFQTDAVWTTMPWQRLAPIRLLETVAGGRAGPWPAAIGAALALWVLAVLVTRRGELRQGSDGTILTAAALLASLVLLCPDKYMNTISFAQRWAPCAMALLIIGLPGPRLRLGSAVAVGLVSTACIATCTAWRSFSTVEMTGFAAALDATPPNARILGLDAVKASAFVGEGRPFMQMMAYLQAAKGGTLSFSFADHGSELVSYRPSRQLGWTPGLEWYPERTQTNDVLQFDVVLMNAGAETHRAFEAAAPVVPVTTEGRWRLYSVQSKERPK